MGNVVSSRKPTPAQAVMLRILAEPDTWVFADKDASGRIYRARLGKTWTRLAPATFRALVRSRWVADNNNNRYWITPFGETVLSGLTEKDFIAKTPKLKALDILDALRDAYRPPEWVFFAELRCGTGYGATAEQRIDAWAMHTWPSKQFHKIAFEVKVYRSDFLRELKDPRKREYALSVSDQFYFVAPVGLISKYEVPEECGLLNVTSEGEVRVKKTAPRREVSEPSWSFVASLGRRIQRQEGS